MKNNYFVTLSENGGDKEIVFDKLVTSEIPLTYEEIKEMFEFSIVRKIQLVEEIKIEK